MTEEEQKVFRLYGKLPTRKDLLANKLKERKYFDSGDYALSKAGRAPKQSVGTTIPNPEMVPHATNPVQIPGAPPHGTLNAPGSPGATYMAAPTSPSGSRHAQMDGSTRSSFPMATGVMAGSPIRESTAPFGYEQAPEASDDVMHE